MESQPKHSRLDVSLPDGFSERFLKDLDRSLGELGDDFKSRYLREEYLSKYLDERIVSAEVRREAAIAKWLAVEQRNSRTNCRLFLNDQDLGWVTSQRLVRQTAKLIAKVLGPLRYPDVIQFGNHTNGASTRIRRSPSAAIKKLTGSAHVSVSAYLHWEAAFVETRIADQPTELQETSSLFTVPKKTDIDRVACKEPECNMLLQRSVGNHIRGQLRKHGVDLNDQTVNQRLAKLAVSLDLATVDLSSASDSVTKQAVMLLLPFEWWSLLDDLRVKATTIDGRIHHLEMFSSMGNGFTFELESLIFWALTRTVCRLSRVQGRISVYGDDIIAPRRIIPRLRRVFAYFGFSMNLKKTHFRGLFRESCGRHYYGGFDVTPFYIRKAVTTLPELINHLNHILEWDGRGEGFFISEPLLRFWERWARCVPYKLWGGIDPADNSALVTGHSPRKRLVPITRDQGSSKHQEGALTLWLLSRRHHDPKDELRKEFYRWAIRCSRFQDVRTLDVLEIDPRDVVGYRARPLISRGERTSWDPWGVFPPSRGFTPWGSATGV